MPIATGVRTPVSVASVAGRLHLFTLEHDGHVLHKSYASGESADEKWQSIGGRFVSPVVAAVARDRVELFALDHDHRVMHRTLGSGDWKVVGEKIAGSLNAFTLPNAEIAILAVDSNGQILFSTSATPHEWKSLGSAPEGELSAGVVDNIVVLACLKEDQSILAAPWRSYPNVDSELQWQVLGTVTSIADSHFSLLERRKEESD